MRLELTERSKQELNALTAKELTPQAAAAYLTSKLCVRTFREMLVRFYPAADLKNKLLAIYSEVNLAANTASLQRKINNWCSGKNIPNEREDIFIIAFALGLPEKEADYLLGLCFDYGIHYRHEREVVYAYGLRCHYSYRKTLELYNSLLTEEPSRTVEKSAQNDANTLYVKTDLETVTSDAEFRQFYLKHYDEFGRCHNKAHQQFCRYYDVLFHPGQKIGRYLNITEKQASVAEVVNDYFRLNMYKGRNCNQLTALQKLLKKNWPNETALINMYNRQEDVSRKVLLLMYIVTGNIIAEEYSEYDEDYIDPEEVFEEHWQRILLLLKDCGMPQLDPRNAFDWLVLYSLRVVDEDQEMSSRMQAVIEQLFSEAVYC